MLSTSARLLRLVALLQTRRYWSGAELCERLEVDVRTVRRDIGRLRELGYPVQAAAGIGGGYQLGAGVDLPPVLFDDDEAVAVAVALRAAAASIGGIEETAVRLLAKLDQLLPARLRRRASALHSVVLSIGPPQSLPETQVLTRCATACRDRECLQFRYQDHKGSGSLREVEPMKLVNYGRRWYLVAWDRKREDWRTFRVDRIQSPLATGLRFTPREPPEDLAIYVQRAISYAPLHYQVRLKLKISAVEAVDRVPSWCGTIEPIDDQACALTTGAETMELLLAQMAVIAVDFEMIDAHGLLPNLRTALDRLNRALH